MADATATPHTPTSLSPERLLAAIIDSSEDAIVSKDLNGVVTSWNKAAERIFGYTAAEMVGQSIIKLMPPDRVNEEPAILARLRSGERVDHFETVRMRKDGRQIDVSLTISPVRDDRGVIVGASKIARDITEQKLANAKLTQVHEALARANRMKGEFISTLSHELRTPLNAITGWLQLLQGGATAEEMAEGIEVIRRNVRTQAELIDDLLDMSRIEAGKLTLDMQRLELPAVITAAMESVRPTAEARGVRLTSAFSSVNGIIMGDKTRLQQVVWNLLSNAVKFSKRGGRVHVTTCRVNSHVCIAVADSGIGIAPEHLETIFERFNQVDSSTTRNHGGLGLGLAIARHLAELHGGTIRAKSAGLGQGATMEVTLPLVSAHVPEEALPRTDPEHESARNLELAGLKVLVIDDEPDSAEIVKRILQRCGASVQTANSMEEGLVAFGSFEPHVVVSDIGMPGQDGYQFIKRLREMPQGRRIPAVALTALARGEDRARSLRAGFQMHIAKPVEAIELTSAIRNLASLRGS